MTTAPPPKPRIKIRATQIIIERAEGLKDQCGKRSFDNFAGANQYLREECHAADPKRPGCDKCDFKVLYADGETYSGNYGIAHPHSRSHEAPDLGEHVRRYLETCAGLRRPLHLTDEKYEDALRKEREKNPRAVDDAIKFLITYAMTDIPPADGDDGRKATSVGDVAAKIVQETKPPLTTATDIAIGTAIQSTGLALTLMEGLVDGARTAGKPTAELQRRSMELRKALVNLMNAKTKA